MVSASLLIGLVLSPPEHAQVVNSPVVSIRPITTTLPVIRSERSVKAVFVPTTTSAPATHWEAEWHGNLAQPAGPARDARLAAWLKKLSASQPDAAAKRLCELHPADRVSVVAAALNHSARQQPDEAIREAIRFCDEDPSYSLEYGHALISTLSSSGHHQAALRFVLAEELEGWLGENGQKWLTSLLSAWATVAPHHAIQAVDLMVDPGLRGEALQAVAAGWSKIDPVGVANYAWQLPASPERDLMITATLHAWTDRDPASAATWARARKFDSRR